MTTRQITTAAVSSEPVESNFKDTFETQLPIFVKSVKESMVAARACAEAALCHFEAHGDVTLLQTFHDAMPKDYSRRSAFLSWARAFSPLDMKAGKMLKDKRKEATPFNIEKALSEPFWEHTKDVEIVNFTHQSIIKDVDRLFKKYCEDTEHASNDEATRAAQISLSNFRSQLVRDVLGAAGPTH